MTHGNIHINIVLYFGVGDYTLQTQTIINDNMKLSRIVFPQNKFSKDPSKTSKKGEQELCFISVTCGEQNTFLIDMQHDLWAFGNSTYSQLGLQQPAVSMPVNISQITSNQFRLVSGGSGFVTGYSMNKKLYLWGNWQSLGYGEIFKCSEKIGYSELIDQQYQISGLDLTYNFSTNKKGYIDRRASHVPIHQAEILALKCMDNITYILTADKFYGLGIQLELQCQFVGISCGPKHILAWDKQGKVWSWGDYTDGKLGYMCFDQKQEDTPKAIPKIIDQLQTKIVQCACGSNYSIALDVKGDIYGWGKGPFKIGLIRAVEPVKLCQKQRPFIKIVAGDQHFGALDLSGQLYGWGINQKRCLGDLEEETKYPTLIDLKNIKIIDVGMGSQSTVLIVPANQSYRLPNLNVDQYTFYQQQRVSEEAALMRDFIERRNKLDQVQFYTTPVQNLCESPFTKTNFQYEQTSNLISRMKTLVDSKKGSPKKKQSTQSLRLETDIQGFSQQINYDYDDVWTKLRQMESSNYLYLPVVYNQTPTTMEVQTENNLDSLLTNENDVLKFQYIQMVKQQNQTQIMMNLLEDNKKINSEQISKFSFKSPKEEEDKLKQIKFHDKFDHYDPYILTKIKRELQKVSQERLATFEKKQKIRDERNKEITEKMHARRIPIQSREEIFRTIQKQAYEREMKIKLVQQKKSEHFLEKINHIQESIYEKSPEFRLKKRLELIRNQQNMQLFSMFLTYLNVENISQILQESSQKGLEMKRMMFKEHMKARIIQNTIRKRNVIKKIKMKLGLRQKKILLSFIFRFKIHFRIKSKYTHIRKINLFHLRNQIYVKVRINLQTINKKVEIIQKFCKWYNLNFCVQISFLNYKWDEMLRQSFKGQINEKEKEEIKVNELPDLLEKQVALIQKVTTPLRSQISILNDLKFKIKPLSKATELRTSLLKKIKPQVQIDEEYKDVKINGQVLLPYTRYTENLALSVAAKIRFDYQMMIQFQVHEKVFMEELNIKYQILKDYLARLRRDSYRQMKEVNLQQLNQYYNKLNEFKESHKQQISNDRMKIMMKLGHDDQKQLKIKDEQETKQIVAKRESARRRYGQNPIIFKDVIFNKIRQLPQDQYPFPNLTLKLVENMCSDSRPKLRLRLTQFEWAKMFNQYQQEMKQRYLSIMNDARKAEAQKAKTIKQNKIIKRKKTYKVES